MEDSMASNQFLRMLMVAFLFLLLSGCGGGGGGGDSDNGSNDPANNGTSETSELRTATTGVENAFISGDPQKVLTVMSDESKAFYQGDINSIQGDMAAFGNDFKNRKLIYATDNYAEYEFTAKADGKKFTVTFSRQDDGTWKLTRF